MRTAGDFAKALFLAELQLDVAKKSKRLAPEAINFCCAAIARLVLDTRTSDSVVKSKEKLSKSKKEKRRREHVAQVTRSAELLISRVPIFAKGSESVDFLALCRAALRQKEQPG